MKLKSLKVKDAYGYMDLNIKFERDLSFLVGINGSGKTTALKLIEAILSPSLHLLDKTPHASAELSLGQIEKSRKLLKIYTSVLNGVTTISIPSLEVENSTLVYRHPEASESSVRPSDEARDPYGPLLSQITAHPVIEFLREKIDTPLFLGIERRNVALHFADDSHQPTTLSKHRAMQMYSVVRRRMPISGQLGSSLIDVQIMIQDIYKKTAEEQLKFSTQLRESIFLDAFDYQPGSGFFKALRQDNESAKFLDSITSVRFKFPAKSVGC